MVLALLGTLLGPISRNPLLLISGGLAAADIRKPLWWRGLFALLLAAFFEGYSVPRMLLLAPVCLQLSGSAVPVFILVILVSAAVLKAK